MGVLYLIEVFADILPSPKDAAYFAVVHLSQVQVEVFRKSIYTVPEDMQRGYS